MLRCALVVALSLIGASHAYGVTAGEVARTCGSCHGLNVNGIAVAPGPGSLGFTANVRDRASAAWQDTIRRMVSNGASVADVPGTAAYLAALGSVAPTATAATPAATPTRPSRPAYRPRPPTRPRPARPGYDRKTPSAMIATPTPTATATPGDAVDRGAAVYGAHCAVCHSPSSPRFVGETIAGKSAGDIREALAEVRQMQFLRALIDRDAVQALARYLATLPSAQDD